jgi:hypothetical protein
MRTTGQGNFNDNVQDEETFFIKPRAKAAIMLKITRTTTITMRAGIDPRAKAGITMTIVVPRVKEEVAAAEAVEATTRIYLWQIPTG